MAELTFKQRRELGLTIPSMVRAARKLGKRLHPDPDIASAQILQELVAENPKAFAKPGINWEAILAFIEKLLPIILQIISIFAAI